MIKIFVVVIIYHDSKTSEPLIHVKVASTELSQAKYVAEYLKDMKRRNVPDDDIAIVLCDGVAVASRSSFHTR